MGDSPLPNPEAASYELALANRKLVTIVMGMTLMMGLIACLSYLAGRSVTGIRTEKARPAIIPPPVIVEAPSAPLVSAKVSPPRPAPAPTPIVASLVGPQLYLQVAAGAESDLVPLRSQLQKDALPVRIVLIDRLFRLLVGPVRDSAHQSELEGKLREAGRPFFQRRL